MSIQSPGRSARRLPQVIALLGALCIFLSTVEYMIPKPLPFLRIGLANLPVMLALDILPFPSFLILICIKVIGQALITGTLFSYIFLFSITGTFFSALVMYFLRRIAGERISFIGIGTAGAVVSNAAQLAFANIFLFKESARYIAPPFLAAGLVTGIALGVFCEVFARRSKWLAVLRGALHEPQNADTNDENLTTRENLNTNGAFLAEKKLSAYEKIFSAKALCVTGLIIMPVLLFNPSTETRAAQFLFFMILVLLSGRKINFLFTFLVIAVITAFSLFMPYGQVIYSFGVFKITKGALMAGIHRAVTFEALVMLSKVSIRNDLKLPGAFGELLSKSLQIFSAMMSRKKHITDVGRKRKKLTEKLDNFLLELNDIELTAPDYRGQKTTPAGLIILALVLIVSWSLFYAGCGKI